MDSGNASANNQNNNNFKTTTWSFTFLDPVKNNGSGLQQHKRKQGNNSIQLQVKFILFSL